MNTTPPEGFTLVEEGTAKMLYPKDKVFYNPVQVQNRDLSLLMINLYDERRRTRAAARLLKKAVNKGGDANALTVENFTGQVSKLRILDALAASGLRSIRYYKELPEDSVGKIVINDLDEEAVTQARKNVEFNGLKDVSNLREENDESDREEPVIQVQQGDAISFMYAARNNPELQFDVIDLDPYGSAAPFLDAAVQAVKNGGMLNVTCTDMAVLSGKHPETCYGRYAAMPMPKGRYLHEFALRILLQTIERKANAYGRVIKPILSVGMAFYIRVFVEVHDDKKSVMDSSLRIGNVYQSARCPSFFTIPHGQVNKNTYQPKRVPASGVCEETGAEFKVGGPAWLAPIHDFDVVDEALKKVENDGTPSPIPTKTPLHGLLTVVSEELSDTPLYYLLADLCHVLGCTTPPMEKVVSALMNAGYRVSHQHKEPSAIKTDAPNEFIWDIMRAWVKEHPVNEKKLESNDVARKILEKEQKNEIDFTRPKDFVKKKKAARYPMNPEANWGPKPRANKRKAPIKNDEEKKEEQPIKKKSTEEESI